MIVYIQVCKEHKDIKHEQGVVKGSLHCYKVIWVGFETMEPAEDTRLFLNYNAQTKDKYL